MKTILLADDRAASRELIRSMLEGNGSYGITEVHNGAEALNSIAREKPDLVLMDLHMPVMDGFETIRALRRDPSLASLPVFALTASAMAGDQDRALNEGFTGFISKPIRLRDLRDIIHRLLPDD